MKIRIISTAVLFTTTLLWAWEAKGAPQNSKSVWPFARIGLSGFYGVSFSRIVGDGLRKTYFAPTSGTQMVVGQPFGIEMEGAFSSYFCLASGFRCQHVGQNTKKRQVMFKDDIFAHDFQTTAEITYLGIPFILKGGLMKERFWAFVRLGAIGQLSMSEKLVWQIDGNSAAPGSERMPAMSVNPTTSSYLLGGETGVKIGRNGFFLLGDLLYGRKSFSSGLPGTAVMQAAELFVGYRRFF
jgi:hypothetical protein